MTTFILMLGNEQAYDKAMKYLMEHGRTFSKDGSRLEIHGNSDDWKYFQTEIEAKRFNGHLLETF